jgi:hypothetical protein
MSEDFLLAQITRFVVKISQGRNEPVEPGTVGISSFYEALLDWA